MSQQAAKSTFSLTEIGRMIGVSAQSMSKYSKLHGFPAASGKTGKYEAMPCIEWWFCHRAPKQMRRKLHAELMSSLGLSPDGSAPAAEQMSESDCLDLQLKAHKVARAVGDCVSFADIRAIAGDLATEIRTACGSVNAATGRDVLPLFDECFDRFEQSLNETISSLTEGIA